MCESCKHFEPLPDVDSGYCYCGPPSLDANGFGIFPIMYATANCGQWKARE